MPAPLSFDIPHSLGKEEAKRRINARLPKIASHIPAGGEVGSSWPAPDHLVLTVTTMGQKVSVDLHIEDAVIKAQVALPLMLSMMGSKIAEIIRTNTQKMLDAPKAG